MTGLKLYAYLNCLRILSNCRIMVRYNTNFLCVSVMALGILFVVFDMYHKKVVEGNKSSRVYIVFKYVKPS